ncbi:MAG TPA: tetratricopeptide repeat protein [Terrimicrobiaceae bacterium]|nr:tetratricopeptide repeat protein [Terrimicrobiaceae bacterium]
MNFRLIKASSLVVALLCPARGADSPGELIAKGDAYDRKLQATEALNYYLPAEKLQPANVHVLVCIARQYRYLLADAGSPEEKLRLGRIALAYSRRAAVLAPEDSEAQLSVGISYGKMLPYLDTKEQIEASRRIKSSADKAIALDPRNDLAWHVLGRWHRTLADVNSLKRGLASLIYGKLPETTTEEAVKCFQKAIEINPDRLIHYVELGRAYAQMGKNAEARQYIRKGLTMPSLEKDDPEAKRRGEETLAKLQ